MNTQQDFFTPPKLVGQTLPKGVTEADLANLRSYLISSAASWRTRDDIGAALKWEDRKIRAAAQALGSTIIRGQLGYKLTAACTRDDAPLMLQAADAAGSQARHMRAYELEVRKAIHSLIHST